MILGIIQARISSSRLPGKVLLPLWGEPMLLRQLERVGHAWMVDRWIVATSSQADDESIASLCALEDVACYRGSLDDVLDRFYHAAVPYEPTHIVRLTGDCPLADPALIDEMVRLHCEKGYDYTSNAHPPTFPNGFDCEVVRMDILARGWREADVPFEREHVMPFIWRRPERFSIGSFTNGATAIDCRLTVDYAEDYEVVKTVFEALYHQNPLFGFQEICTFLGTRPELIRKNAERVRNAPLQKQMNDWEQQRIRSASTAR